MKMRNLKPLAGVLALGIASTAAHATVLPGASDGIDVVIATAERPAVRPDAARDAVNASPVIDHGAADTHLEFGAEHKARLFSRAEQAAAAAIRELEISFETREER